MSKLALDEALGPYLDVDYGGKKFRLYRASVENGQEVKARIKSLRLIAAREARRDFIGYPIDWEKTIAAVMCTEVTDADIREYLNTVDGMVFMLSLRAKGHRKMSPVEQDALERELALAVEANTDILALIGYKALEPPSSELESDSTSGPDKKAEEPRFFGKLPDAPSGG